MYHIWVFTDTLINVQKTYLVCTH